MVHHKERLTYCRLDRESNLLAEELVVKGVKKGDRVGLFLDNGCEYLTAYFGILKTGAVVVGLNSQYVARELYAFKRLRPENNYYGFKAFPYGK